MLRTWRLIAVATLTGAVLLAGPSAASAADGRKALVLVLHAYGMTGLWTTNYFRMGALADRVVVLAPNGSRDVNGKRAWNASLACCNPYGPDDVGTLSRLVEARIAQGDIDPSRVYVWGYSNGAFMAWRLACARADLFRAIVLVGGSVGAASDPRCVPSQP